MYNFDNQKPQTITSKKLNRGWIPISLQFNPGQPTLVSFNNGCTTDSMCINCHNPPCAKFRIEEITPVNLEAFPADKNYDVCACGAISTSVDGMAVSIDNNLCVLCGVCSSRCPMGAIYLIPNYGAVVNRTPNEAFIDSSSIDIEYQKLVFDSFEKLPFSGSSMVETDDIVIFCFDRMEKIWTVVGDRFPNFFSRNLLIGSGIGSSIGRKGNNHMRMDIILSFMDNGNGIAEVEFGQESILNAPRDILDSLAVMTSRYNWVKNDTKAIIVSDVLPNKRSEYWRIIQDISNIVDVKISTITIFTLMILNWFRIKISEHEIDLLYADVNTKSYRKEILQPLLGRELNLCSDPNAHIDISK